MARDVRAPRRTRVRPDRECKIARGGLAHASDFVRLSNSGRAARTRGRRPSPGFLRRPMAVEGREREAGRAVPGTGQIRMAATRHDPEWRGAMLAEHPRGLVSVPSEIAPVNDAATFHRDSRDRLSERLGWVIREVCCLTDTRMPRGPAACHGAGPLRFGTQGGLASRPGVPSSVREAGALPETPALSVARGGCGIRALMSQRVLDEARELLALALVRGLENLELLGRKMSLDCALYERTKMPRLNGIELD